uniref:C2H2-type domain-containing protein n=1 Tax=Periophthalmus magnuspinnatus TaxID=409849 RepID=A0A3B3ZP03_9GOBI
MNELLDRPYVCGAPGCSQRFQSEEHLSIHRHKHEMTLKFNSIKSDAAFTADTPTPTKFLQNCDEVGLFKEIEEEFLQAQEEEKKQHSVTQELVVFRLLDQTVLHSRAQEATAFSSSDQVVLHSGASKSTAL